MIVMLLFSENKPFLCMYIYSVSYYVSESDYILVIRVPKAASRLHYFIYCSHRELGVISRNDDIHSSVNLENVPNES